MDEQQRIQSLIQTLELSPHPEGGRYQRIFESAHRLPGSTRSVLTSIYFLLQAHEYSRWHRVDADEVWYYHEGAALELFDYDPDSGALSRQVLGPVTEQQRPAYVVAAQHWQAARPLGGYCLVSCAVAPGFEFSGFTLLAESAQDRRMLHGRLPDLLQLL